MSFSSDVKDELSRQISNARHCQIAEITAIISLCGDIIISANDNYRIRVSTENVAVARKYFTLLKRTFNIDTEISIKNHTHLNKGRTYMILTKNHEDSMKILKATRLLNNENDIEEEMSLVNNLVVQQLCCRRAFIRGAFLAAGSISDPNKFYHFEIVCSSEAKAIQLCDIINTFELDAKIVARKKYFVVYIKEGTQIVEILNIMEAHVSLMNLENVRILKEMRNSVNRKVNCETANLNKTVEAALKQIKDIEYIRDTVGLETLSPPLYELAQVRLNNPDTPLKDLGQLLSEPVGKSGVNHRLKKISEIADNLREN